MKEFKVLISVWADSEVDMKAKLDYGVEWWCEV